MPQLIRTLRTPLQLDSRGGLAYVSSTHDVVRQQLTDLLGTNHYERVMRPTYGADIRALLFSPKGGELATIRAGEIKALLQSYVKLARIVHVVIVPTNDGDATMRIDVSYSIVPSNEVTTFTQFVSGLVTEETL